MGLRKKLELNWQGKQYKLQVTMEVIDNIEDHVSIAALIKRQQAGDVRLSHIAKLISVVLNLAGANTTQEEVYEGMYDGKDSMREAQVVLAHILSAMLPTPKKKDEPTKDKSQVK